MFPTQNCRDAVLEAPMPEKAGYPEDALALVRRLGRKLSDRSLFLAVA